MSKREEITVGSQIFRSPIIIFRRDGKVTFRPGPVVARANGIVRVTNTVIPIPINNEETGPGRKILSTDNANSRYLSTDYKKEKGLVAFPKKVNFKQTKNLFAFRVIEVQEASITIEPDPEFSFADWSEHMETLFVDLLYAVPPEERYELLEKYSIEFLQEDMKLFQLKDESSGRIFNKVALSETQAKMKITKDLERKDAEFAASLNLMLMATNGVPVGADSNVTTVKIEKNVSTQPEEVEVDA